VQARYAGETFLTSRNDHKIRDSVSRKKKKMQPMQVMQEGRFPIHD
jgi:hypothetical protein